MARRSSSFSAFVMIGLVVLATVWAYNHFSDGGIASLGKK